MNTWLRNGSRSTPLNKYPWPIHLLQSPYTLNPIGLVSPHLFIFLFLFLILQSESFIWSGRGWQTSKVGILYLMTNVILGAAGKAWMCIASDLVITGTMPGKGRAWERPSINGWAAFSLGESPSQQVDSPPAHDKGLGTLDKIADLTLSAWSGYSNASLSFVLPNTKPCPDEGNRKPFVTSGLGLSLRCFSEFMVHSGLELPYTRGCPVFGWDLGQGRGKS